MLSSTLHLHVAAAIEQLANDPTELRPDYNGIFRLGCSKNIITSLNEVGVLRHVLRDILFILRQC